MAVDGFEGIPQRRTRISAGRIRHATHIAGGLCSIALLLGAAIWGYRLAVRDVAGVPVIRAMEGAMRVAPDDPGGRIAAHAGLSVNAVIGGQGTDAPETIRLAPAALTLADEDAAGLGPRPAVTLAAAPVSGTDNPDAERVRAMVDEIVAAAARPASAPQATIDTDRAVAAALSGVQQASAAGPGTPRPRPRPATEGMAGSIEATLRNIESTVAGTVPVSTAPEIDPASLPAGTRLAQIGVFPDPDTARAGWDRIAAGAGALMDGKARVLQPARSGGRDFIRLRVRGFDSEDDARRFCAAIETGDLRCIPVTHR